MKFFIPKLLILSSIIEGSLLFSLIYISNSGGSKDLFFWSLLILQYPGVKLMQFVIYFQDKVNSTILGVFYYFGVFVIQLACIYALLFLVYKLKNRIIKNKTV